MESPAFPPAPLTWLLNCQASHPLQGPSSKGSSSQAFLKLYLYLTPSLSGLLPSHQPPKGQTLREERKHLHSGTKQMSQPAAQESNSFNSSQACSFYPTLLLSLPSQCSLDFLIQRQTCHACQLSGESSYRADPTFTPNTSEMCCGPPRHPTAALSGERGGPTLWIKSWGSEKVRHFPKSPSL